jgi:hypothetical protein
VRTYIERERWGGGGGHSINYKGVIYKTKKVILEVWLNVKLVGRTKYDKTQRNIALLCAELQMVEL